MSDLQRPAEGPQPAPKTRFAFWKLLPKRAWAALAALAVIVTVAGGPGAVSATYELFFPHIPEIPKSPAPTTIGAPTQTPAATVASSTAPSSPTSKLSSVPSTVICNTTRLEVPEHSGTNSFDITVFPGCKPATGQRQIIVVELLNQGSPGTNKHSEFYLLWEIRFDAGSSYKVNSSAPSTPELQRRYFVIQVSTEELAALKADAATHPNGFVLSLNNAPIITQRYPNSR